jgi:hypothetical protein
MYQKGEKIIVSDCMQQSYEYVLTEETGKNFDPGFKPHVSPREMLEMGVFEGKYCNDCQVELPSNWFKNAKTSMSSNPALNYFSIKSRQSLSEWKRKGWIVGPDPRGWFQWYCRYYLGRRILDIDQHQIKRWKAFRRHEAQVLSNCEPGNWSCRPRQRQALLQWAYNPNI